MNSLKHMAVAKNMCPHNGHNVKSSFRQDPDVKEVHCQPALFP